MSTVLSSSTALSLASTPVIELSRQTLHQHARSFRWGAAFLSRRMRDDAAVVYAFCRAVDDAVDEAPSVREGKRRLASLEAMLEGRTQADELVSAYRAVAERTGFGLAPARDLIEGARSDLGVVELNTDAELLRYCYRVAGTVGLMMCGVLEVREPEAKRHAIDLGTAMQLTNICRDVLEDAEMGRVYLPRDRLRAAGTSGKNLLLRPDRIRESETRRAVSEVVSDLLRDAELAYSSASLGYRYIPLRPRLAIMVAASLYRGIGRRLERVHAADPLRGRTVVPWPEKLGLVVRASWKWLQSALTRRPRPQHPIDPPTLPTTES